MFTPHKSLVLTKKTRRPQQKQNNSNLTGVSQTHTHAQCYKINIIHANKMHALALRTPPIPFVRIALIGLGQRGMRTLQRYADIEGAEICAIADISEQRVKIAEKTLCKQYQKTPYSAYGNEAWHTVCQRTDIDLVYVCTDWLSHAKIAAFAMKQGKHVAVEVPLALTMKECEELVAIAERTQRHCFMTENCCYDLFALSTLEMAQQGLFGDIHHCEGAYIHCLDTATTGNWMIENYTAHHGNPYPTHGMGPIGWLLDLHRGDRMETLVSFSPSHTGVNHALIRTALGRTIFLQLDITTPRPYSRHQTICGTKGFAQKYPQVSLQIQNQLYEKENAIKEAYKYNSSPAARAWHEGQKKKVENAMNYAMDARLIYCLRHGLPLDIDVYDAAEWSCLAELTAQSAKLGGMPVNIPDFTKGQWQTLKGQRFYE